MNNLINITNKDGKLTVSSREVAERFEKRHDHVVRDVESIIKQGCPQNWGDLFIEAEYQNAQNKQYYKQYELTRDGFSLLAMGFTGAKALEWKLKFIEAFNKMEDELKNGRVTQISKASEMRAQAQLMNAQVRKAKMYAELAKVETLSATYKEVMVAKAADTLNGGEVIPLPKLTRKTFTATEIGEIFGVSSQKIGAITNKHNLKTAEYGEWYRDKAKWSNKEVDTFKYYDNVIPVIKGYLESNA